MTSSHETLPVTKSLIEDDDARLEFLPKLFGDYFMQGESLVFEHMKRFCPEYTSGYWNFFSLSNGSGYMAVKADAKMDIEIESNMFSGSLSAEAAGIVVTLFVLSQLGNHVYDSNQDAAEEFFQRYHDLCDYAREVPEWDLIRRAID